MLVLNQSPEAYCLPVVLVVNAFAQVPGYEKIKKGAKTSKRSFSINYILHLCQYTDFIDNHKLMVCIYAIIQTWAIKAFNDWKAARNERSINSDISPIRVELVEITKDELAFHNGNSQAIRG